MQNYHDLIVWKRAMVWLAEVYKLTSYFPQTEKFNLTQQLQRSASSVAANIVEGRGKPTDADFLKFLYIARGSHEESKQHLEVGKMLGYLDETTFKSMMNLSGEVGYLLYKLILSLERTKTKKRP